MKIFFIDRKYNEMQLSIEKLFSVIRNELKIQGVNFTVCSNPYNFTIVGIIKTLFFFNKKQGAINHITGDVHWISLVLKSKNTILTIHDIVGVNNLKGFRKQLYYWWWIYLPIKKVKYVTVISKKTKDDIVALMPEAEKKIKIIYNCVTIKGILEEKKKSNGIPEILIIGTRSNKNIERIIYALKNIPCKLTIVGLLSDNQKNILKACEINFENYPKLTDEELLAQYKKANIVPFISTYEGFGLPIIEGQAQDCVIITSNIEPMLDVAGKGAIFVNPLDVESIKEGFLKVISNTALQQKLIMHGRENIKRFEVSKIAKQYISLYKEVYKESTFIK